MSKKHHMQKVCRIFQWIEQTDKDLAAAIRDLCMEGALSPGRNTPGVTFLYPTKEVRKKIVADTYSAEPENAIRVLEGHIVPDAIRTTADFQRATGSRLGVRLDVESSDGAGVTLQGGAKLVPAADFVPLRRDNIAVWVVDSGEVPLSGAEFKVAARGRATRGGKGRGQYRGGADQLTARQALASHVEAAYSACMRADHCRARDPYLISAVSLLNFLRVQHPDQLLKVLPMLDRDPAVTFYLLLEPYKTSGGDYVLDGAILFGPAGWNGAEIYEGAVSEFESFFELIGQEASPSAEDAATGSPVVPYAFRDTQFVRSAVDEVRMQILGEDGKKANKINTPKAVRAVYRVLADKNAVAGAQPVLPDETVRALPGAKKLWQDELRFVLHAALQELRQMPIFEDAVFAEIIQTLRLQRPGNDYATEAALSSAEALQANVAPQSEFLLLLKFINSTDFLYIPVPAEKIGGAWGDVPVVSEPSAFYNPADINVYNAEASKQRLLGWYRASGQDTPRVLDQGSIAAVQHYIARHGALPPGLRLAPADQPAQ